jgi:hypothetical protein
MAPMTQFQLAPTAFQTYQVFAPSVGTQQSPGALASPDDQDYLLLAQGFGGRISLIRSLEDFVKGEADKLFQRGGLGKDEIATLLLDATKNFMTSNGFGFSFQFIEPVVRRLINRAIGNRGTPSGGNVGGGGTTQPPTGPGGGAGSGAFDISGRVYITPAKGTGPQGTGPQGTGPQGTGPQGTGPQGTGPQRGSGDGDGFTIPGAGQNAIPPKQ